MGLICSMSALTSLIAVAWSGVSSNGKESSNSCCQTVSWLNSWPLATWREAWRVNSSWAISRVAPLTFSLTLAHSADPKRVRLGGWSWAPT